MRANRVLVAKGWYWVSTDVNNREGVFRLPREVRRLRTVLRDARKVYEFEVCGLRVEDDRVSFYINAVDGGCGYIPQSGTTPAKTVPILKNLKKIHFFAVFLRRIKAKHIPNRIKYCEENYFQKKY
jgi:hypothetical protein